MRYIAQAYKEGKQDALSGQGYNNPYIPPENSDETFDWKPDHEQSYHDGFGAYHEGTTAE